MTIKELMKRSHDTAVEKGFWASEKGITGNTNLLSFEDPFKDPCRLEKRNDGALIALMHSELSEALEALRHGNPKSEHIPEFSAVEEEVADLLIRVADYCQARNIRLEEALEAKMKFNKNREYKHGKKF
jgi:NTP pyrophosphatase (non-canonical NTP hydrolase)